MNDNTPPNWPIHNVGLTDEQLSDIIAKVYTGSALSKKTQLGKKKSFNNRIYFVQIEHQAPEDELPDEVVIKVNGRFFGSSKVQNEVASLVLLQQHCSKVPAPRVLAWSEDGSKICAIRNGVFAVLYDDVIETDGVPTRTCAHGWIMITKLPGRILQSDDLSSKNQGLVEELADIVASWRADIPHRTVVSNLALQPAGYTSSNALHGLELMSGGLILCETQPPSPIRSSAAYYTNLLSDQMHKVDTKQVFDFVRSRLLKRLQSFRESLLPHLLHSDSHNQEERFVFTQQDFAPRNVLVQDSADGKLHVSGIVDFEFAGFFPPAEEFLNCKARQSDDWSEDFFESLCVALASRGIGVPGHNTEMERFDVLRDLAVMIENVAPWWLQDGHVVGKALEEELTVTCKTVENIIDSLTRKRDTE